MPTQTPLSGGNASFDPDQLFPDYQFTRTDRFWVQLDHRNQPGVTMVIGLDPQNINSDLDEILLEHQRQFETPRSDRRPESGSMESSVLGRVVWSGVSIEGEESEVFEIALYALHPRDQTLIVARSEFPSETDDTQAKLNELVAATEAVAPGL
jgi:hypothetical protein